MTSLRPHLYEGYVEFLDAFGNVAAARHGTKNAKAVFDGECSAQRCYQIFHEFAVRGSTLCVSPLMPEGAAALRSSSARGAEASPLC